MSQDQTAELYQCCPGGAAVDVRALAAGNLSSVMCLRCGRWFLSHSSPTARGFGGRMPGDVYIDPDGSFNMQRKAIRDLIATLSSPVENQNG